MTGYDPHRFPPFAVTVDLAVFTIRDGVLAVLLVRRGEEPFLDRWALPGGFVRPDEDTTATARRELAEETGLTGLTSATEPAGPPGGAHLEQLRTYSGPDRDPRMRVVSVAYVAFAPDLPEPVAGTDARQARWWDVDSLALPRLSGGPARAGALELAFDHAEILADAVDRVASKIEYTSLATAFCPPAFTLGELQQVYEAVWGVRLDRTNFRRKVRSIPDLLEPVPGGAHRLTGGTGRPATLYRTVAPRPLQPPLLRPPTARHKIPTIVDLSGDTSGITT